MEAARQFCKLSRQARSAADVPNLIADAVKVSCCKSHLHIFTFVLRHKSFLNANHTLTPFKCTPHTDAKQCCFFDC